MRHPLRTVAAGALAAGVAIALSGCGGSGQAASAKSPPSTARAATTTTVPQALWLGQARDWLTAHADDLTAISTAAKNMGDAAKAGNGQLTQIAITQFMTAVGKADGELPANSFGQDLHAVFVDYITSLGTIRKGLLNGDQATYKAGSDALAAAVGRFGAITARLQASP